MADRRPEGRVAERPRAPDDRMQRDYKTERRALPD
jgi:hypothetical protein